MRIQFYIGSGAVGQMAASVKPMWRRPIIYLMRG